MDRLYRTMKKAPDGLPMPGRSARMLGVRVEGIHVDVRPDAQGHVLPGQGGMSVTVDDPLQMPVARRARWLARGASEDPLSAIEAMRIVPPLSVRVDAGAHALVEPAGPASLATYEADLASTRPGWELEAGPKEV